MRFRDIPVARQLAILVALATALWPAIAHASPVHPARLDPPPDLLTAVTPARSPHGMNGVPDTGQFLPDTALLARMDNKRVTARDFVVTYFNAYPPDRPRPDSLGRVKFLKTMIDKELLGLAARNSGYDIGFEGRVLLRQESERVLANVLFRRAVLDSVKTTEEDILRVYQQFKQAVRVRRILFVDRATAERVRLQLVRGQISWREAVKKYSRALGDRGPDGDMGWIRRPGLTFAVADIVYATKPGEISQVVEDQAGPQLLQIVEVRPDNPPPLDAMRGLIEKQLFQDRVNEYAARLQEVVARHVALEPDTANLAWASRFFPAPSKLTRDAGGTSLNVDASVPEVAVKDTGRVLMRWNGGRLTLGEFVTAYGEISPLLRPTVNTPEALAYQAANVALEPYKAKMAIDRGYDKDPSAVAQIEMRRERILVERMYSDSVLAHVRTTPAERRAEYDRNPDRYEVTEKRRFATIVRMTQAAADSLAAELRSGASAESVITADSLAGFTSGAVHVWGTEDHGVFKKVVFEELKRGQVTTMEDEKGGRSVVVQLLDVIPARHLTYREAEDLADENLRTDKSEELMKAWLARLRAGHEIVTYPERVMRIRLVDPTL